MVGHIDSENRSDVYFLGRNLGLTELVRRCAFVFCESEQPPAKLGHLKGEDWVQILSFTENRDCFWKNLHCWLTSNPAHEEHLPEIMASAKLVGNVNDWYESRRFRELIGEDICVAFFLLGKNPS
jgi:hypothetical protein